MENIINKTKKFIKEYFENESTGHDYYHALRVYKMSLIISKNEKCNIKLLSIAALLHDVDDYKIAGYNNYFNTKKFLKENAFSDSEINKIINIIDEISYSKGIVPHTIEGKILQDADRLDAMGAIGIARCFAYGGKMNNPIYDLKIKPNESMENYKNKRGSSINHFYEKLLKLKDLMNTQKGKELAKERHKIMENYLKEFYMEVRAKK